jgi:NAD(P)-dependent dehydrogenase (short-subunit alcohol dehydrogenase family)
MSIKKGRVAVVTGAGSGLGKAIAQSLAAEGAYVIAQDIDGACAEETAAEIKAAGNEGAAIQGDVSKKSDCIRLVQAAVDTFGTLDILVNNAGILRDALIHKMSEDEWDIVIDVILKGTFLCTQAAIKVMKEKKYGRIINISSIGYVGYRGQANYAAAKAGVVALTRVTAAEYTWCGITANCICPGPIVTPMALNSMGGNGKWMEYIKATHPMGHAGKPEDVAYMVKALAAEEAEFITAQTIAVDGGYGRIRI